MRGWQALLKKYLVVLVHFFTDENIDNCQNVVSLRAEQVPNVPELQSPTLTSVTVSRLLIGRVEASHRVILSISRSIDQHQLSTAAT